MNPKSMGEKAESCVIGELAKWCIDVALPMSDNHPFDMILLLGNKMFKAQVKSTSVVNRSGTVSFDLETTNWYLGESRSYDANDCDIVLCYNLRSNSLYLLAMDDFKGQKHFSVRTEKTKNNQKAKIHYHDDYVISVKRIKDALGIETTPLSDHFAKAKMYTRICKKCQKSFEVDNNWKQFCSRECRNTFLSRSKVKPHREALQQLLEQKMPWTQIGRQFGVSDGAVKKWARGYGLI